MYLHEKIKDNYYSLSAGQYFDIKIENLDITKDEFEFKIQEFHQTIQAYDDQAKSYL